MSSASVDGVGHNDFCKITGETAAQESDLVHRKSMEQKAQKTPEIARVVSTQKAPVGSLAAKQHGKWSCWVLINEGH